MLNYDIKGTLTRDPEKNGVKADSIVSIKGHASGEELVAFGNVLGEVVAQFIDKIGNDKLLLEFSKQLLEPIEKRVNR